MTFAAPGFLWLLLAVPLVALAGWRAARRPPETLAFPDTVLAADLPPSPWLRLRLLPTGLRLAALTLGILALARPQVHDVVVERTTEGIDILLVLDVSMSMQARDFPPNRFEAAVAVARTFVESRPTDRIGLVAFAGEAVTLVPLTHDHAAVHRELLRLRLGELAPGTAIGNGLATAVARLHAAESPSRVAILLTDGQNNRGSVDPMTAAELAATLGVRTYVVGVGAEGRDAFGRPVPEHLRELLPDDGVDAAAMTALAERTGGRYFHAGDRDALEAIYAEISALERTTFREETRRDVAERYTWFLWPALLLVLLDVALSTTRLRTVP